MFLEDVTGKIDCDGKGPFVEYIARDRMGHGGLKWDRIV